MQAGESGMPARVRHAGRRVRYADKRQESQVCRQESHAGIPADIAQLRTVCSCRQLS